MSDRAREKPMFDRVVVKLVGPCLSARLLYTRDHSTGGFCAPCFKGRSGGRVRGHISAEVQPERKTQWHCLISLCASSWSGAHFGHSRIAGTEDGAVDLRRRNSIHIIDLAQTVPLLHQALKVVSDTVAKGGRVLFVGTKRQAAEEIAEAASARRSISSTRAGSAAR